MSAYPKLVLQFIRAGALDSDYGFELVSWFQVTSTLNQYEITVDESRPTASQIGHIQEKGSLILVNKIINDI
jgi:hypothetical protein